MKKIIKVSVGIAAFNEEKNIRNVIQSVLMQDQVGWCLKEILVYNDGSDDKTKEKVIEIDSKIVHLKGDDNRKGKTFRLSQMFKDFNGDLLVMYDGDIVFSNNMVTTNLLKDFEDEAVMLIGGNSRPEKGMTFFQRSVECTFFVFDQSRKYTKGSHNVFGCTGSILAMRKKLAKQIKLPKIINEDTYIYFTCLKKGYKFAYQPNAIIYYKLPNNLKDYLRQTFRSSPEAVDIELQKYFGGMVKQEFYRPPLFLVKQLSKIFVKQPVEVMNIILINILCKPLYPYISKNFKLSWFTAKSTH